MSSSRVLTAITAIVIICGTTALLGWWRMSSSSEASARSLLEAGGEPMRTERPGEESHPEDDIDNAGRTPKLTIRPTPLQREEERVETLRRMVVEQEQVVQERRDLLAAIIRAPGGDETAREFTELREGFEVAQRELQELHLKLLQTTMELQLRRGEVSPQATD